jgi:hypothetical protein
VRRNCNTGKESRLWGLRLSLLFALFHSQDLKLYTAHMPQVSCTPTVLRFSQPGKSADCIVTCTPSTHCTTATTHNSNKISPSLRWRTAIM